MIFLENSVFVDFTVSFNAWLQLSVLKHLYKLIKLNSV
jgi:hypothetical protein